jgi:hypothetical protein
MLELQATVRRYELEDGHDHVTTQSASNMQTA